MCMSSSMLLSSHSRSCHDNSSSAIPLESQNSVVLIRSVGQGGRVYFSLSSVFQKEKEEVELSVIRLSDMSCRSGVLWGDLFSRKLLFQRSLLVLVLVLHLSTIWWSLYWINKWRMTNDEWRMKEYFSCFEWGNYAMCSIQKNFKHGKKKRHSTMRYIVHAKKEHYRPSTHLVVSQNISRHSRSIIWITIMIQSSIFVGVLRWWQKFVRCLSSIEFLLRKCFLSSTRDTLLLVHVPILWVPFFRGLLRGIRRSFCDVLLAFYL